MFRFFTSDIKRNAIKLLCLTLGLFFGLLLTAKIYFEASFDRELPGYENIYRLQETAVLNNHEVGIWTTSGGVVPGLLREAPDLVASGTRDFPLTESDIDIFFRDGTRFPIEGIYLADSCRFDVLETEIIAGNPTEILSTDGMVMIPQSLADKIDDNPIGMIFTAETFSQNIEFEIGGIYQDYPANSSIGNPILLSMASLPRFMDTRAIDLWMGNDFFRSFIRLDDGVGAQAIAPKIKEILYRELGKGDVEEHQFNIVAQPLTAFHQEDSTTRNTILTLSILTVIIQFCASLNYLLVVTGQIASRSREMAIRQCFGTGKSKIFKSTLVESAFFVVASAVLAILFIFTFPNECGNLLGYVPDQLFSADGLLWIELAVLLVVFLSVGLVPSFAYCSVPVVAVFGRRKTSHRFWKLALLGLQFFASAIIFSLLVIVNSQYNMIDRAELGFNYQNLARISVESLPQEDLHRLMRELKNLPGVSDVTSADTDLLSVMSSNNAHVNGQEETDYYDIEQLGNVSVNVIEVLGLETLQGGCLSLPEDSLSTDVIVEEAFINGAKQHFGWTDDDIVGRKFIIDDDNGDLRIIRVIKQFQRGGIAEENNLRRAGVMQISDRVSRYVYVRFEELSQEMLDKSQRIIDRLFPGHAPYIVPMISYVNAMNNPYKLFRNSVAIVGFMILLLTLIGLLGYIGDEVQSRAKEIAIRKVNGTSTSKILRILNTNIISVAIPSLTLGGITAIIIGQKWLEQFARQTAIPILGIIVCLIVLLLLILTVATFRSLKVAHSNPVEYLRGE